MTNIYRRFLHLRLEKSDVYHTEPADKDSWATDSSIRRSMGGVCPDEKNTKLNNRKEYNYEKTTKNTNIMASPDITALIPEEELAVSETMVSITELDNPYDSIISVIPEEELATPLSGTGLAAARKAGCFLPVQDMKGFKTSEGHRIFARITVKQDGTRFIEFCQQYSNGEFSPRMEISQADFLLTVYYILNQIEIPEPGLKRQVSRFLHSITAEYLNRLAYPQEMMPVPYLLEALYAIYPSAPVKEDRSVLDDPEALYAETVYHIKNTLHITQAEHKSYYALCKEQIETMAREMELPKDALLKKLKEYNFLYLAESSKHYQTYVRFHAVEEFNQAAYSAWAYCILNLEYLAQQKEKKASN